MNRRKFYEFHTAVIFECCILPRNMHTVQHSRNVSEYELNANHFSIFSLAIFKINGISLLFPVSLDQNVHPRRLIFHTNFSG